MFYHPFKFIILTINYGKYNQTPKVVLIHSAHTDCDKHILSSECLMSLHWRLQAGTLYAHMCASVCKGMCAWLAEMNLYAED